MTWAALRQAQGPPGSLAPQNGVKGVGVFLVVGVGAEVGVEAGAAVGILRGALYEKTKGTPLAAFPMPLIPMPALVEMNRFRVEKDGVGE